MKTVHLEIQTKDTTRMQLLQRAKAELGLTADPIVFQHGKVLRAQKDTGVTFRIDIPTRLMLLFTLRLTKLCVW